MKNKSGIAILVFLALTLVGATANADEPAAAPAPVAAVAPASTPAVAAPATTEVAVVKDPADPVADADKVIDDSIKPVDDAPGETVGAIISAFKEGRWGAAIGLLIMLLVWITRKFIWTVVPKKVLPWLTLGLAMVVTVGVELLTGISWWKTLIDGFITGGSAMAFWSLLFKHILPGAPENS